MKNSVIKSAIILTGLSILLACNSMDQLTIKNQEQMFTEEQIKATLGKVKSGADFPAYIQEMKKLGVIYYETFLKDGHSIYYGKNNFELSTKPKFELIPIADKVNAEQLKTDIYNHQQGKSDYSEIIKQCAGNGIEKWAICMNKMTCTYYDKSGNKILIEQIPEVRNQQRMYTVEQIKEVHSKVKSGADFPAYIQDLKKLGVIYYETFVADGHTDYYGTNDYIITSPAKYHSLTIAEISKEEQFQLDLKAHQDGKIDFTTFCNDAAKSGVEKWAVCMDEMACTYFDKTGNKILIEKIPQ